MEVTRKSCSETNTKAALRYKPRAVDTNEPSGPASMAYA